MLAIALPHVEMWNVWFADTGNAPDGVGPLREQVDHAARSAGRDPASIERTVAVQVRLGGGQGRIDGSDRAARIRPLEGSPEVMAEALRAYAREGIAHVQLVLDPITSASIREFAPVLGILDRG